MDRPEQVEAQTIYARRKWSAERLSIPLNSSKKEARTQWLKSLEENDFLPDEIDLPAWRIVSNAESAAEARKKFPAWSSYFDDAIGQEIEAFAQRFFSLDLAARRKEFTRLLNASRDNPRQQKRLSSLSPALKLPSTPAANEYADDEDAELMLADVEEVSQHLRELFVATPPARARMHLEFLREHADELPRWASAAKVLKDTHSPLVELVPHEWEDLSGCDVKQRQAAEFQAGLEERVAIQALKDQREDAAARSDSGSFLEGLFFNRYAMFAAVWIAIKIGGAVLNSSPSPPKINYTMPSLPAPQVNIEELKQRLEQMREQEKPLPVIPFNEQAIDAADDEEELRSEQVVEERDGDWRIRSMVKGFETDLQQKIERRKQVLQEIEDFEDLTEVLKNPQRKTSPGGMRPVPRVGERRPSDPRIPNPTRPNPRNPNPIDALLERQNSLEMERDKLTKEIEELQSHLSGLRSVTPKYKPLDASP